MSVAELEQVTKRFGRVTALDCVSFAVANGEALALLGPNGAGKSTALGILLGIRRPDGGTARVTGADPRRATTRRVLGVTPQETDLPSTLKVREVLEFVRAHYTRPLAVDVLLERFELERFAERQLGRLSGGERRRVAVALAFAGDPLLVVLDEPTTGLDAVARAAVWAAVLDHADRGGTVLFTTHHLDEAEALASRIVLLEDGRVLAEGTVAAIKAEAGLTAVSFRAPPGLSLAGAERHGDRLRLLVRDGGAAVAALVRDGIEPAELEVRPLSLEEALEARRAR